MDQNKNFFQLIGDWWANRQSDHKKSPNLTKWLPTPGNVIFTILILGLLIATQGVWAAPLQSALNAPGSSATTINYQGRLADIGGTPLDGTYGMSFALYDAATVGNLIWGPEQHTAVEVSDGLFSVGLGSQTSGGIPTTTWNGDRYLEITVDGETLEPRELIRSVPIAGMALTVPDGSMTLEKLGLKKYDFSTDGSYVLNYVGPSGVKTTLDLDACVFGSWCCNPEGTLCYLETAEEDTIEFSLEGSPSITCLLLHNEDDRPRKLDYATDIGNGCHLGKACAILEGQSLAQVSYAFGWLCGW